MLEEQNTDPYEALFRTHDEIPVEPVEPRDPEIDRLNAIPDRVERAIAWARHEGREAGWTDEKVFEHAVCHVSAMWNSWQRRTGEGVAWCGYRCDWHRIRMHFQHLPCFRRPVRGAIPYPPGSFEVGVEQWFERELNWTREWKGAELEVAIYCAGGGRVIH